MTRPLNYSKATAIEPLLKNVALDARQDRRRPADEHAHHLRPARVPRDAPTSLLDDARPARTAGGDRGADHPDDERVRPRTRRAVGLQRRGGAGTGQHDRPGVPEQRPFGPLAASRGSGPEPVQHGVNSASPTAAARSGSHGVDQRRVPHRRRAVGPRSGRARSRRLLTPRSRDAEQHQGHDHPRPGDPVHDQSRRPPSTAPRSHYRADGAVHDRGARAAT